MKNFEPLLYPIDQFTTKTVGEQVEVYDPVRGKYVVLTPEEWVRQNIVRYLVEELQYPQGRMNIEADLTVFRRKRRADIVVYDAHLSPCLVVECKRPEVSLSQNVANQVSEYNIPLQAPWLIVTNGKGFYCWKVDLQSGKSVMAEALPSYEQVTA